MKLLVVDVGTSGVRAAVVTPEDGAVHTHHREVLPSSPAPGLVEFDAVAMAEAVLAVARQAASEAGTIDAVGIANQRASTLVWDRATGEPVGPGLGWQDLRTVIDCLMLAGQGLRLAPNLVATKAAHLIKEADPDGTRDLCVGTVDSWVAWTLSEGSVHVTDSSNAALYGMLHRDQPIGTTSTSSILGIKRESLPTVVDSIGIIGNATALPGAPPIAGILGDQQASLLGQGCVRRRAGQDHVRHRRHARPVPRRPAHGFETQGTGGTFPIVTRSVGGGSALGPRGGHVGGRHQRRVAPRRPADHLRRRRLPRPWPPSARPARAWPTCRPCSGLGTPTWDYGARGALLGLTRGSGRPQIVRAVLEGVAQRAADLVEAAETDSGLAIPVLRVDGGMTANPTFLQALADATGRPSRSRPSPRRPRWAPPSPPASPSAPGPTTTRSPPAGSPSRSSNRSVRSTASAGRTPCERAEKWFPDLSAISF